MYTFMKDYQDKMAKIREVQTESRIKLNRDLLLQKVIVFHEGEWLDGVVDSIDCVNDYVEIKLGSNVDFYDCENGEFIYIPFTDLDYSKFRLR